MHMMRMPLVCIALLAAVSLALFSASARAGRLDPQTIAEAAGTEATRTGEAVRIGWRRDEVAVRVDEAVLPPAAGLGSWAAFKPAGDEAIVTGDTVVFQDEVDAAMDAAFANGLKVTALHNHFFYDEPKVYFMHIGGRGSATELAAGVRAVWEAIRAVRAAHPQPTTAFPGNPPPRRGEIEVSRIAEITGLEPHEKPGGVVKVSLGRAGRLGDTPVSTPMGLTTWAAFAGNMESASVDGDVIMHAAEVQTVLKTLREAGYHVVALHNHMVGESPDFYFTHFWAKGRAVDLAKGFKAVLEAQARVGERSSH